MIKLDNNTKIEFLENSYSIIANKQPIDLKISKTVLGIEFGLMPALSPKFGACLCALANLCQTKKRRCLTGSLYRNIDGSLIWLGGHWSIA